MHKSIFQYFLPFFLWISRECLLLSSFCHNILFHIFCAFFSNSINLNNYIVSDILPLYRSAQSSGEVPFSLLVRWASVSLQTYFIWTPLRIKRMTEKSTFPVIQITMYPIFIIRKFFSLSEYSDMLHWKQ